MTLLTFQKDTGIVPKALQNRPTLRPDCKEYLDSFWVLDASRPSAMEGLAAIPISEMKALMEVMLIPKGEQALKFIRLMQALDDTKQSHWHKRVKT